MSLGSGISRSLAVENRSRIPVVLVHSLWRCLQLIFTTKNVLTVSLWMRAWLAEMCHELWLRDDLAKSVRRTLDVIPGTRSRNDL